MFQLPALTSEQQSNLQRVANATALYMAIRPTTLMIQTTVNTALIPAYSNDPVLQGTNSAFLPLTFPLAYGFIDHARYGYTVELADAAGNKELLPCWGIYYTPYLHLYWPLPPSLANGQRVIVFDANFYPLLEATFKYYAEDVFAQQAQAALISLTYIAPFDASLLGTIGSSHAFNRKTAEAVYQGGAMALDTAHDIDEYFSAPELAAARIGYLFNNNLIGSPVNCHFTLNGSAPTIADSYVAPGDRLTINGNANVGNLKLIALRPANPTLNITLDVGYRATPEKTETVDLAEGVVHPLTDFFTLPDMESYNRVDFTNNVSEAVGDRMYYTTDGTDPTLASPSVGPGETVMYRNLTITRLTLVKIAFFSDLSLDFMLVLRNTNVVTVNEAVPINLSYDLDSYFSNHDITNAESGTITNNNAVDAPVYLHYTTNSAPPTLADPFISPGGSLALTNQAQVASFLFVGLHHPDTVSDATLSFTITVNSVYAPTDINSAAFVDIEEGIKVGRNSLNFANVTSVKVFNERRIWQKFTDTITVLPVYPATGELDARLRQAVFLEMTDDTHCLIDATLTPELVDPAFIADFPAGITAPAANTPIWIWLTNEPTPPIPWLVVAERAEGTITDDRGYYVPEGDEWYDDPMFGGSKVAIRDGLPYTNQNTTGAPPFANIGSHRAVPLVNGIATVAFPDATGDAANSNSVAAYLWSCDSDLATFSNATIQHPTLTLSAAGWYEVTLKITDSQGNIGYGFRYVYVYDLSQPAPKFIGNPSFRSSSSGWSTTITLPASETMEIRDNSFLLAWRRSWFNNVEDTPIGEPLIFCGYITTGSIKINPETSEVTFQAATIDEILKAVPVQAWAVQPAHDAGGWEVLPQMRIKRLLYYGLKWFSNALEVTDFYFDPLATQLPDFAVEPSDLFSAAQQAAQKIYASFMVDQAGRVYVYRDAQMLDDSERADLPVINSISYQLHLADQVEFTKNPTKQTRQVRICGDVYDGNSLSSVGAAAPYPTPSSSGGKITKYDRVPVVDQAEAASLARRRYAFENMPIKELRAKFSADWSGLLSPAWRNWFTMTIPLSETGGLFEWNTQKLRVTSTSLSYDSRDGILRCEAVFEPEATTMVVARPLTDCANPIPPGQERGISVPPSPPTVDDQPAELPNKPILCPLKCYDAVPVGYAADSCQYAKVTVGAIYVQGNYALRDTTWQCGEAIAIETEEWLLADCEIVVHSTVVFTDQGDGFYGSGSARLKAGQTVTGAASESLSYETSAGLSPAFSPGIGGVYVEVSGSYVYELIFNIRRCTMVLTVTGLEIIPPA